MVSGLEQLLAEGIVSEVLGRLQSGKEAEVFVVRYGDEVVAAKIYKDRAQRSFKNNSSYKEGRLVRNSRDQRAMDRGSRFGKQAAEDAWKSAEADALYKLHAAQVRVPRPVLFFEGVLLMELVRDAEGNTASRLIDTSLSAEQANFAYHDMLGQLVRMLTCDLIHGDLSPYNVLWAEQGATIIDFPQIVAAAQNSNSERFFLRDADNILGHFAGLDPTLRARRSDPSEIWQAYLRRELTPDFRPTGKARLPPPRLALPPPASAEGRSGPGGYRPQSYNGPGAGPRAHANAGPRPQPGFQNQRGPSPGQGNPRPHPAGQGGVRSPSGPGGPPRAPGGPPHAGGAPRVQGGNHRPHGPSRPHGPPGHGSAFGSAPAGGPRRQGPPHAEGPRQPGAKFGGPPGNAHAGGPRAPRPPGHGGGQRRGPAMPEIIVRPRGARDDSRGQVPPAPVPAPRGPAETPASERPASAENARADRRRGRGPRS